MKLRPDEEIFVKKMAVSLRDKARESGWQDESGPQPKYRGGWNQNERSINLLLAQLDVLQSPMAALLRKAERLNEHNNRHRLPGTGRAHDLVQEFYGACHAAAFALQQLQNEAVEKKADLPSSKHPRLGNLHLHADAIFFAVGEFDHDRPRRVRGIAAACMREAKIHSEPSTETVSDMLRSARDWFRKHGS